MKGFTLVEMLIVVAIIGILGAMAYQSYGKSVAKGRRAAAKSLLMEIVGKEQQYLLDQRSYVVGITTCSGLSALNISATSAAQQPAIQYYSCSVAAGATTTPPTFTATLTPTGQQARDEASQANAGVLTINQSGAKTGPW